jgi:hypothetical protein
MPHSTFVWEGLDGSRVLTHFPPADTYCSHGNVKDVVRSERQHRDKNVSNHALLLFGHGDGMRQCWCQYWDDCVLVQAAAVRIERCSTCSRACTTATACRVSP